MYEEIPSEDVLDVKMKMYEAQAIAIEKEEAIEKLRKEMQAEIEKLRQEMQKAQKSENTAKVKLKMYEAKMKAIEREEEMRKKQLEMERLRADLQRMFRQFELHTTESSLKSTSHQSNAVCNVVNGRQQEKKGYFVVYKNYPLWTLRSATTGMSTAEKHRNTPVNGAQLPAAVPRPLTTGKEKAMEQRCDNENKTILLIGYIKDLTVNYCPTILFLSGNCWLTVKAPRGFEAGPSVYLNGEIYIFSGEHGDNFNKLDRAMKWIKLADIKRHNFGSKHCLLAFDGCVWIFGGAEWDYLRTSQKILNTVLKYVPKQDRWISMPTMRQKRKDAAVTVFKRKIYVCGGQNRNGWLKSTECFDPASNVWTPFVEMPGPFNGHLLSDGHSLIAIKINLTTVGRINPEEGNPQWSQHKPTPESRILYAAFLEHQPLKNRFNGSVIIFDGKKWRKGPKVPVELKSPYSVVIPQSFADTLQKSVLRL